MNILEEIDSWKLDAKFENSDRYFYPIDNFNKIESGEYSYVIARKGCGKTAISQRIYANPSYNSFSEKLTFKNFPFNDLYDLSDNSYTQPNQYITLWKYLIYSSVCRMFVRDEAINGEVSATLEQAFGGSSAIKNLRRAIGKWVNKEWSIKLFGLGGKFTITDNDNQSWIDKVDILEDVITEHIDESNYYVLFDELDEDYSNILKQGGQDNYLALITSLFKAVQDIRQVFSEQKNGVKPIIFLRDDIYDLLTDSDKNKWNDFRVDIDWNVDSIKRMLAHRISKAQNSNTEILNFREAWDLVFLDGPVRYGTRQSKKTDTFTYMVNSTHLRPRDFVRYLQACAHETLAQGKEKVSASTVKKVDKAFSNYLRNELIDEMHGILPDVQEVFAILSEIRKWVFSIEEFKTLYNKSVDNGTIVTKDPDLALKILFHFSVIGNQPAQKQVSFFRYTNKEARFNFNENIVVHRGLFKSLQIL